MSWYGIYSTRGFRVAPPIKWSCSLLPPVTVYFCHLFTSTRNIRWWLYKYHSMNTLLILFLAAGGFGFLGPRFPTSFGWWAPLLWVHAEPCSGLSSVIGPSSRPRQIGETFISRGREVLCLFLFHSIVAVLLKGGIRSLMVCERPFDIQVQFLST